jgi:hypothetical protein
MCPVSRLFLDAESSPELTSEMGANSRKMVVKDAEIADMPLETRLNGCRLTTARVIAIKQRLVARYREEGVPLGLAREAIAAAEAQAWGSGFPHLFLPDLADEIVGQLRQKRDSIHPELAQAA